jgi:hypothetical protein
MRIVGVSLLLMGNINNKDRAGSLKELDQRTNIN